MAPLTLLCKENIFTLVSLATHSIGHPFPSTKREPLQTADAINRQKKDYDAKHTHFIIPYDDDDEEAKKE